MIGRDKKNEYLAREMAANYKDLVDNACDLIQCIDSEGKFVYVNQAWLSTLNYSAEEIANITLWDIIHPDSMEHCMATFEQVLKYKASCEVEAIFVAKDGTLVMVEGNVGIKLDENGLFVNTRGIFRDVTARKQMEASLLGVEAERKALLDAIPDLMFLFNKEGYFVDYKANNHGDLLLCPENFMEKHVSEALPSDLAELTLNRLAQVFESGKTLLYEYPLEIFGEQKIFESRLVPCGNDRALAIVRDITERKQAEKELQESRNLLNSVFQSIQDGISVLNTDLTIREVNHTMEKWYGHAEPFIGKKCYEVFQKRSEPCVLCPSIEALKKKTVCSEIVPFMGEDEQVGWIELYAYPLLDKTAESVTGVVEFVRDITDRKRAEEALKESEMRSRALVGAIPDLLFRYNREGVYLDAVVKEETLLYHKGRKLFSQNTLVGKTVFEALPFHIAEMMLDGINKVLNRGNIEVLEYSYPINNAEKFFEARLAPIGGTEVVSIVRDITDRKKYENELKYISFHDQLTGLYNRHYLEEEMKRLDSERQLPISIIMADLNGLKLINDTYGHQTGDEMLKHTAVILKSVCRDDDLLARFGGDEFVLYLPRTSEDEALKISSRIELACRKERIEEMPISLSTGVAVKVSAEQKLPFVLRDAEDKMYKNKLTESRSGKSIIVSILLNALVEKSFETEIHTRNMQEVAREIGKKLGLPNSELHRLSLLITLHDIGKINIPEELLTQKEGLIDAEWEIMKKHSETGYRIAKATGDFSHVADDILAHHEHWDGSGYPQGLKGEEIPLLARITAIADAYEVMSRVRSYKKAMSKSAIVAEFKRCAGTHFDPELVEIFLSILEGEG